MARGEVQRPLAWETVGESLDLVKKKIEGRRHGKKAPGEPGRTHGTHTGHTGTHGHTDHTEVTDEPHNHPNPTTHPRTTTRRPKPRPTQQPHEQPRRPGTAVQLLRRARACVPMRAPAPRAVSNFQLRILDLGKYMSDGARHPGTAYNVRLSCESSSHVGTLIRDPGKTEVFSTQHVRAWS